MPKLDHLRLVGSGGANRAMEAEFKRLYGRFLGGRAPKPKRADPQTLVFPFDAKSAWMCVNYARTPSRALWDLFETTSTRLEPLYEDVRDWMADEDRGWLGPGLGLSIRVDKLDQFEAGQLQIRGTIKNGILEAGAHGMQLDADDPDVLLVVREQEGHLRLSVDLGGGSLHKRGYRAAEVIAPLKETLAAQMLMLARWNPREEALLDPMAGSGTIAIEAAKMAGGEVLWHSGRRPLADRLPVFAELKKTPLQPLFPGALPPIFAGEIHTPNVDILRKNIAAAEASDAIFDLHGDLRDLNIQRCKKIIRDAGVDHALQNGLLIVNPPYGERLSPGEDDKLNELYAELGALWRRLGPGWRACFLVAHPDFEKAFGAQPRVTKPMSNGPIKARFVLFD